jgi:hypothetical protein
VRDEPDAGLLPEGRHEAHAYPLPGRDLNFLSSRIVVTLNAMKTKENLTEQQADEEAVNEHVLTGKPLDPEVYRRVRARAEKITAELRRKYGDMNISADLIREVRDEE